MKNHALLVVILTIIISATVSALTVVSTCNTNLNNVTDLNWQLDQNITNTQITCLDLNTSNIILDCNGYKISTTDSTNYYFGLNISAPNVTVKNCLFENYNNTDFTNLKAAIILNTSNVTLYNSTLKDNYYHVLFGEATNSGKNHTFYNLTITGAPDLGISSGSVSGFKNNFGVEKVENTTFYNVHCYNLTGFCLYFAAGQGVSIYNSTFADISLGAQPTVIAIDGNQNPVNIYNNTFTNIYNGITFNTIANYVLENNTFTNFAGTALDLGSSTGTTVARNNTFINSSLDYGAIRVTAANAQIYNNYFENIYANTSPAGIFLMGGAPIFVSSVLNITTMNNTFVNSTRGLVLSGISNATSYNDIFISPQGYEYTVGRGFITDDYPNLTVVNATFRANDSALDIMSDGSITVQQLVNVTAYKLGLLAAGVTVNVLNSSQDQIHSANTDLNGVALFNVTYLYKTIDSLSNYTPHNFTFTSGQTYYNNTIIPYQNSQFNIYINAPTATQCANLTTASATYSLTQNETTTSNVCLNVTVPHVTIDCNGYWIIAGSSNAHYGIFTNATNLTVKNCGFTNFGYGSDYYTLYDYDGVNLTVYNSTFYNNMYAITISSNLNLTNSTFINNNVSIDAYGHNYTIYQNTFYSTIPATSVHIGLGSNSIFQNNNVTLYNTTMGAPVSGLGLDANYSNITDNFIHAPEGAIGVSGSFINISNNTLSSNESNVVLLSSLFNSTISNNTFSSCPDSCIQVLTSDNITITQNNFSDNSTYGDIYLSSASNVSSSNNIFTTGATTTPYFFNAATNITIFNENLTYTSVPFNLTQTSNATVINSSFDTTALYVIDNSKIYINQPVNITIINTTGSLIPNALVNITNGSTITANGTSDTNGYFLANATVLLYDNSNTPTNYSQTTIYAFKTNYATSSTSFNITNALSTSYQTATVTLQIATTINSGGSSGSSRGAGGAGYEVTNAIKPEVPTPVELNEKETKTPNPTQPITNTQKPTQNQEYLPKTSQTQQDTQVELPVIPIALLALVAISAIIAYTQFRKEKTMTSIVAAINESYEKPLPKPSVQQINTPVQNQIIKPQTTHKEKIELYSELPQIHSTSETTNVDTPWDLPEDIPAETQEPEKLSLSQRALNKIKSIFQ